jgi:hypothetical protein
MMNIGVVCEGPTDYPAIEHYFKHALQERNVATKFRALYPEMDNTKPTGGWANVLLWLNNNPPTSRIPRYFGAGLFGGALATEPLNAIIIHLDTDILPNESFRNYVKNQYDYDVIDAGSPIDKANQITEIISISAQFQKMTNADKAKHVPAPAVESTEAWCVAAFTAQPQNFEILIGTQLINSFMTALEQSEGRVPAGNYNNISKDTGRRQRFCERHANGSSRIIQGCQEFSKTLNRLVALS